LNALGQTNWNRKMAAKLLKISYKGIFNKIREYDLARTPEGN
jgi:DNA-binding NtrC family response regulator